mgnify:CR=1 FL=1
MDGHIHHRSRNGKSKSKVQKSMYFRNNWCLKGHSTFNASARGKATAVGNKKGAD